MTAPPALCVEPSASCWRLGFAGNTQPSCSPQVNTAPPCSTSTSNETTDMQLTSVDVWQRCFFESLRVDPQEHAVVIAEPLGGGPKTRQALAELMFETFSVAALHISPAPLLALHGGAIASGKGQGAAATGVVVDCGLKETRVVPVLDGCILHGAVQRVPVGGHHVTVLAEGMLRDRGEPVPSGQSWQVAEQVKQRYGYVCQSDVQQELAFYEERQGLQGPIVCEEQLGGGPQEQQRKQCVVHQLQDVGACSVNVMQERFLGPELYFSPTLSHHTCGATPLPWAVDAAVQACPIDCRRSMYSNILLAGGSAHLQGMSSRLQHLVQQLCSARVSATAKPINVDVWTAKQPVHTVWLGASLLASSPGFEALCPTREQYQEAGASLWCSSRFGAAGI